MKYLIKYRTRNRRYALVRDFCLVSPTARDVQFTVNVPEAMQWDNRADAERACTDLRDAFDMFRRRKRFTVVREDWQAPQCTREYRPKGTIKPTGYQSALIENAVAVCYARAAAVALDMPKLDALQLFVINTRRGASRGGRGRHGQFFIAIQQGACTDTRPGWLQYIVAHELAHVADVYSHGTTSHGPLFMAMLKMLCPPELQAYELTYKQSSARAAGITVRDALPAVAAHVAERLALRRRRPYDGVAALQAMLAGVVK